MAIDVVCTCGAKFRVNDEWAGRKARCTKCGSVVRIETAPAPEPFQDLSNEDPLGLGGQPTAGPSNDFSDLLDEDIPLAASASPASTDPLASESPSIQITVDFDVRIPNDDEVSDVIRANLHQHFAGARPGTYNQVQLEVHVLDWNDHGTRKVVALSFFGDVNDKRISKNFSRDIPGIKGAVNIAAKAWDSATSAVRGARLSKQMREILENIVDDACVHIDRAVGGRKSSSSKLWETFDIIKVVLTLGTIFGILGFVVFKYGFEDFGPVILMALVAGGAVFVPIHTIQLLVAPASFYTEDPRGRRVLSRWKAKNVAALRIRLGVMVTICATALVGFWMMISSALNPDTEQGPAHSPQSASRRPSGHSDSTRTELRHGSSAPGASDARSKQAATDPDDPDFFKQNLLVLQSGGRFDSQKALKRLVDADTAKLDDPEMHKQIAKAIRDIAFDDSAMVDSRNLAIQGLVHWGGKFAGPVLVKLLQEDPHFIQGEILKQLAVVKEPTAIDLVVEKLLDSGLEAEAAANCLITYGPVAEDPVLANLRADNPRTVKLALKVLAEIGTEKSLPALDSLRNVHFARLIAKDRQRAAQMIQQREADQ